MTIDLSTLKPGDTVHFRCGGKAVVDFCCQQKSDNGTERDSWGIYYKGDEKRHRKTFNKTDGSSEYAQPFDIIRVESAFRWEDVKPGMAFAHINGERLFWYIGPSMVHNSVHIFADKKPVFCKENLTFLPEFDLTRAPEHDIEVKI